MCSKTETEEAVIAALEKMQVTPEHTLALINSRLNDFRDHEIPSKETEERLKKNDADHEALRKILNTQTSMLEKIERALFGEEENGKVIHKGMIEQSNRVTEILTTGDGILSAARMVVIIGAAGTAIMATMKWLFHK